MKNVPWGIFAAVCAMLLSFVTVAIVAVFTISGMMYSVAGGDDGLRESWWLVLLYVTAAIALAGFCVNLFFYIKMRKSISIEKEG